MWVVRFFESKRFQLLFPVAIFLLLRQDVKALLEPCAFLSRTSYQTTHHGFKFSLRERPDEETLGGENDEGIKSDLDETKLLVQDQQEKIDMLMKLLSQNTALNEPSNGGKNAFPSGQQSRLELYGSQQMLPPIKAMVFIDGTWLYYSMHERAYESCPIQQRFGKGWQFKYNVDWGSLPRVICQALQDQEQDKGWATQTSDTAGKNIARPIEITRVSVFTSYKSDTPKTSFRYQMFEEMLNAQFDVHMMETVGRGEKCVDIQLAVDMLHYATVPDAYDVALLLTGDKDFMPAMGRCRQKGRRIGLVSMRRACNRALYETPNLKDFEVIWLEDHLDKLIQQKPRNEKMKQRPHLSELALIIIVMDFIKESRMSRVSSRDIGKYIKTVYIGQRCVLDEVKQTYGGLYQFLIVAEAFVVEKKVDSKLFWVTNRENIDLKLRELRDVTTYTTDETNFFDQYDLSRLEDRDTFYYHSLKDDDENEPFVAIASNDTSEKASPPDYTGLTVVKLKEICRDRELALSGRKADLIERIVEDDRNQQAASLESLATITPAAHIEGLISEYLQVKGGKASSRDVGRYLQANKSSEGINSNRGGHFSALMELKKHHGSIRKYIMSSELFEVDEMEVEDATEYEFLVRYAE